MNLTRDDKIALHRLFSPYAIPSGLTHEQVRLCIKLDGLRDELRETNLGYFWSSFSDADTSKDLAHGLSNETSFKEALYGFLLAWANK